MDKIVTTLLAKIDEVALLEIASKALTSWASENDKNRDLHIASALQLKSHKLCFKSTAVDYPYFESTYALVKDDEETGIYTLITSIDGKVIDDSYEIY